VVLAQQFHWELRYIDSLSEADVNRIFAVMQAQQDARKASSG